jgi:sporulation protein YlmC with PRC-barrel domain
MTFKPLVLSFSLLAFAGASAFANDEKQSRQPQSQSQARDSAAAGASGSQQSSAQRGEMRASNLEGTQVVNSRGEEIGDIKDIVIDLNSGRVHAAVLGFGGMLGIGEENFAFPINELKPGKQQDQVVMNIDKQKLENREGFSQSQWPGMDDEYWTRTGSRAAAGSSSGQSQKGAQGKMNLVRASELDGKEVQDKSGRKVGQIQDVVVSLQNGQVKSYVVSLEDGGRATVQGKALKASGTEDRLVLDVDAQQLKQQAQRSGEQRRGAGAGGSQATPQSGQSK